MTWLGFETFVPIYEGKYSIINLPVSISGYIFLFNNIGEKKEIATKFFIFISREKVLGLKIRQSKRCIPQFFNVSWPFFYKWKQKKNEKEMGRK